MKDRHEKKRKTFKVKLTHGELVHLRDLFSILLPLEMKETLSQHLARAQDRVLVKAKLWAKLVDVCKAAELPLDDDAPDFVVTASGPPPIGVFELSHEHHQQPEPSPIVHDELGVFGTCTNCGRAPMGKTCPTACVQPIEQNGGI